MIFSSYHSELQEVRKNLTAQIRNIEMRFADKRKSITVSDDSKVSISKGVIVNVCSLNSDAITVINVVFSEGGDLAPHSHDRVEHIYILDGTITDKITGQTYFAGSVYRIPPDQIHHIVSDYALLTVTWVPAYPGGKYE
jgi:quercetin dioxygenase-like cupin family protein